MRRVARPRVTSPGLGAFGIEEKDRLSRSWKRTEEPGGVYGVAYESTCYREWRDLGDLERLGVCPSSRNRFA